MAGNARSRSKKPVRKPNRSKQSGAQRIISILQGLLTTIILVGAGILIGSFWGEWGLLPLGEQPTQNPAPRPLTERIKVEILNGSGEVGLAQRFSDQLRGLGFDVVSVGNADHFDYETTYVLDRSGRPGAALEVAEGLRTDSVVVELNPQLFLDATVVVGHDWPEVTNGN